MPIRRVLLDAFGTVFSPREPVFQQYTAVARQYGLQLEEGRVKDGFKQAFKQYAKQHPLYGKHSEPPMQPEAWWRGVIQETFRNAGAAENDYAKVKDDLSTALLHRFHGRAGYALHCDVLPFLSALRSLSPSPLPPPGVASNTDPSVFLVLRDLGVIAGEGGAEEGIREEEVWTTWELEEDKKSGRFWEAVLARLRSGPDGEGLKAEEVLVVGDEVDSDYHAPRSIGMRSLLLRRDSEGEHPNAAYEPGPEDGMDAVRSLEEVVEWIARENSAQ
ncbi:hypothetical protein JCM6882_003601 [Rhodosporidiobolus microsporus]